MIVVHHLEKSRSQRVLWLLEELGQPYEVKVYKRDPKTILAPKSLMKVHPLGKSPVITDGEVTVAESGAILEYLVERYDSAGRFKPKAGAQAALDYRYWLHYAEGSLMTPLILALVFSRLPTQPMPFFVRPVVKGLSAKVIANYIRPQLQTHFRFVEQQLAKSDWFAGDAFSAADIQMSYPLMAAVERSGLELPRVRDFVARVKARPAWQRAESAHGPFELPGSD
ncbi:glutathione S-transferase [Aquimonas voraii]|uniref:glutathione transferase n=1 Tax=Aquimonas voraii TaxID=265719 RepID=A0A1G6SJK0_9GAMM|nr:glutathione S-transferase [Aquimonas voraii]SDD17039.1 glutathione S-transferase [Aquimonas voraii]